LLHFYLGHAGTDITPRSTKAPEPLSFAKYLRPVGEQPIHSDIFASSNMPNRPANRVQDPIGQMSQLLFRKPVYKMYWILSETFISLKKQLLRFHLIDSLRLPRSADYKIRITVMRFSGGPRSSPSAASAC
jgi:hypothetical protein